VWRRFIMVTLVALGAWAALVAVIKSPRLATALKTRLERAGEAALAAKVHIGTLELRLLPPAVVVQDVEITQNSEPGSHLTLRRGRLRPHPHLAQHGHEDRDEQDDDSDHDQQFDQDKPAMNQIEFVIRERPALIILCLRSHGALLLASRSPFIVP